MATGSFPGANRPERDADRPSRLATGCEWV